MSLMSLVSGTAWRVVAALKGEEPDNDAGV